MPGYVGTERKVDDHMLNHCNSPSCTSSTRTGDTPSAHSARSVENGDFHPHSDVEDQIQEANGSVRFGSVCRLAREKREGVG